MKYALSSVLNISKEPIFNYNKFIQRHTVQIIDAMTQIIASKTFISKISVYKLYTDIYIYTDFKKVIRIKISHATTETSLKILHLNPLFHNSPENIQRTERKSLNHIHPSENIFVFKH